MRPSRCVIELSARKWTWVLHEAPWSLPADRRSDCTFAYIAYWYASVESD
jgi:hypothetical protein